MNNELAEYDMCKLRVRDLESTISKWQSEVKYIINNPMQPSPHKILNCKKKLSYRNNG